MRLKFPFVSRKKYEAISMAKFALQLQRMQDEAALKEIREKLHGEQSLTHLLVERNTELSARLDWNANQLLEMEKSVQFGNIK